MPRILVIQHDTNAPAALLADAARAAGLALDIRLIEQGAPVPDRVEAEAGLVVLGGEAGVFDAPEHPYLFEEMDLIQEAAEEGKLVLGICLGSQLAAEALGGAVRQGESGVEIGWVDVRVTEQGRQDPVAAALGRGAPLLPVAPRHLRSPAGFCSSADGRPIPSPGVSNGDGMGRASAP